VVSFTLWSLYPRYPLTKGWAGTGAGLEDVEKRKISCPHQEANRGPPVTQPVTQILLYCTMKKAK